MQVIKTMMSTLLIVMGFYHQLVQATPSSPSTAGCLASQFRCTSSGRCLNLNLFCDGRKDCEDNSDEPVHCTYCNRTYYAGTGESYRLLINWPKANQMPFTCFLTFTSASPDPSTEFLQVRLDTATIGQYLVVQNQEGSSRCPDGCMQILDGDQTSQQQSSSMKMLGLPTGLGRQWLSTGAWCGASITPRFYYTDSTSVTLAIRLLAIPASLQTKLASSTNLPQQHPVLDLTYRVLPRSSAIVRYGSLSSDGSNQYHLGEVMAGQNSCSRWFRQCANESVQCRIQSPGYPGIYPRHAHCFYRISHRPSANPQSAQQQQQQPTSSSPGRRHVVVLWQNDGRKINLRDWDQPVEQQQQQQQKTRSASECQSSGDYISVYDGTTTSAPVLARFCDGPLPEVVSSGPDVLVEFRSSPLDTIFAASTTIEGFELKVRVVTLVDPAGLSGSGSRSSSTTVGDPVKCRWNVTSSGLSRGWLVSPQQTWPLGTTCQFRFLGRPDERVWIYFGKYHFVGSNWRSESRSGSSRSQQQQQQQCRNVLRIAEGDGSDWDPGSLSVVNGTVIKVAPPSSTTIGLYCRDKPPPLCERQLVFLSSKGNNSSNQPPPPCLAGESFISRGSTLTVQQHLPDGTAFTLWKYLLVYEFFRENLDGRPLFPLIPTLAPPGVGHPSAPARPDCNRLLSVHSEMRGNVKSPQNVFLFGRGGAQQLRCIYRFEGEEKMRVAIEVTRLRLGGRQCRSGLDPLTHQRRCRPISSSSSEEKTTASAFLQLRERPWGKTRDDEESGQNPAGQNVLLERDCLCETGLLPFRYLSTGSTVEVVFQVDQMSQADDFHDFFFEISFEFLSGMKCPSQSELRPLQGPGGLITLDGLRGLNAGINAATTTNAGHSVQTCNRQTWFLLPRPDRFLFLSTTNGFKMKEPDDVDHCLTKNRILIYASGNGQSGRPMAVICPSPRPTSQEDTTTAGGGVKIFTPVWSAGHQYYHHIQHQNQELENEDLIGLTNDSSSSSSGVVIEFIAIQSGSYQIKWLELTPQAVLNPAGSVISLGSVSSPPLIHPSYPFCSTWCPELKACVDSQLWCDGVYDCPSGVDEMDQECQSSSSIPGRTHPGRSWTIPKVYWYLMAAGSTLLALFVIVSSVLVCRGGNKPLMDNYQVNGDLLSPTSPTGSSSILPAPALMPSALAGGSFRPPPIAALNDYVYPDSTGGSAAGSKLVLERSHYDKKMAVS